MSASTLNSMRIGNVPEKLLVYTNHIYVNPAVAAQLGLSMVPGASLNYRQMNGLGVFIVSTHKDMPEADVGVNALQRETCRISAGDVVKLTSLPSSLTDVPLPMLTLRLSFEMFADRTRAQIREDDMAQAVLTKFDRHVFMKGQVLAFEFQGKALKLHVVSLQVPNYVQPQAKGSDEKKSGAAQPRPQQGDLTKYATYGLLTSTTKLSITPLGENRHLTFEKSASASGSADLLRPDWKFEDMGIGGLNQEFQDIFRRAFASRLFPPEVVEKFGIKHVRGMLLHGPAGTGKTLIARQIGKMLAGREPKVINGPSVLNSYVGKSEENIRLLFADAEKEYKAKGDASSLHIIIFDEIDAICKARGSDRSGTGVHDTVVNQLLSMIDGVNSLNNILVIGMTNRKDMIDEALLRPGRLEVHVEIGLPDEAGRLQIFNIHTKQMRDNQGMDEEVDLKKLSTSTKNFSGAEIEGVVKSATSFALYGKIDATSLKAITFNKADMKDMKVKMQHFEKALTEVIPAFGVDEDDLRVCVRPGMYDWGVPFSRVADSLNEMVQQLSRESNRTQFLSVLLTGEAGSGKTALAAQTALRSGFPFVKLISPDKLLDLTERGKCLEICKVFEAAYRSPLSLIILDGLERLLDYVSVGPRFSNAVLQTLMVLLKRIPAKDNHRLMVITTTSMLPLVEEMQMKSVFNSVVKVPLLDKPEYLKKVALSVCPEWSESTALEVALTAEHDKCLPMSIKQLLLVLEMTRATGNEGIFARTFCETVTKFQVD